MKVRFESIIFATDRKVGIIDITRRVEEVVAKSGVKDGLCLVHAAHATMAIVVNEHETGLLQDILTKVNEVFPPRAGYRHDYIDDNAHAHLASAFIGSSRAFPVKDGRILRGTWQNILAVEMDGPRSRREVIVEALGE